MAQTERLKAMLLPADILWGLCYGLLPTLAILVGSFKGAYRDRRFFQPAMLYLIYMFPYVLISHNERYQVASLSLQVWLVWYVFFSEKVFSREASD